MNIHIGNVALPLNDFTVARTGGRAERKARDGASAKNGTQVHCFTTDRKNPPGNPSFKR